MPKSNKEKDSKETLEDLNESFKELANDPEFSAIDTDAYLIEENKHKLKTGTINSEKSETIREVLYQDLKVSKLTANKKTESSKAISNPPIKKTKNKPFVFKKSFNALELFNLETLNIPKLLTPFLQKTGVASLVGTSDTGKSTFLRQLSLNIALKSENFLNFPIRM